MSDCEHKNPLTLSGTAQEDRLPKFLDPDMVKIDGKTEDDYRRIVQELSELVQYYDGNHLRVGGWEDFFKDNEFDKENPHIALFNAFISLIQYAQDDINDITAKHLEFYYKDVLQLALRSETVDEAHIIFELANNISGRLVEEGTYLKAGKDANAKERLFKTTSDIVVNNSAVSELKSIYVEEVDGNKLVYASPVANSSDGIGGDLDEENPKWAPFGEVQSTLADDEKSMELTSIGFAIASEYLLLKEGDRKITLILSFASSHGISTGDIPTSGLNFLFSGEEEWIEIEPTSITVPGTDTLEIVIDISADEDAVLAYDEEVYEEQYDVTLPVMKMLINQEASPEAYNGFTNSNIESIQIDLDVDGVKDLVLQNETGTLNPSKPFEIFSSRPVIGSEFFVGSKEIFGKTLTHLNFTFDWLDKPQLNSYYDSYSATNISTSSFDVEIEGLRKRSWEAISNPAVQNLFGSDSDSTSTINLSAIISDVFDELVEVQTTNQFTTNQKNGFIRFQLVGPTTGLIAFGHSQYQNLYLSESIKMARSSTYTAVFPNEPYTPKAKSLSIDYQATHTLTLNQNQDEGSLDGHIFHVGPFGIKKKKPTSTADDQFTLVPKFEHGDGVEIEGGFYIGIEDMSLPQNLNALFQVAEGSANPDKLPSTVVWSYLVENDWVAFEDAEVLSDSTNGLINSGIIKFDVPKTATNNNTWLANGLHWFRASIESDSDSVCEMIDVRLQAITAEFENNDNDLAHLEDALPAETISKLKSSDSAIRKVEQPYASFNGKLPEEEDNYYRRAAERLRHKNRPITIWDFERIVLEEYSSVYKVKCLNHTRMIPSTDYSEKVPGHVSVVVVSNLRNQNAIDAHKPTTSVATLDSIKAFLGEIKNPFITIDVQNPLFEEIQVDFNVKFRTGYDKGFYQGELNEAIKRHLSPWAYIEGEDISFDGVIHKSKIIDFIEELEYVDYLTCFKMYQGGVLEDINEAVPTKSASILVSADNHDIDIDKLLTDDCSCEGDVTSEVITDGIGAMTIAVDFIVNKP
ncbi:MAG: hypothetical protein P8P74_06495 [Crocinitomicaceae bacterium]|nr:hypothetical protein [Crocinitomicaceae bacterium]